MKMWKIVSALTLIITVVFAFPAPSDISEENINKINGLLEEIVELFVKGLVIEMYFWFLLVIIVFFSQFLRKAARKM